MKSALLGLLLASSFHAVVLADDAATWPNRPVKIVHGFGASGSIDYYARVLAAQFKEKFGQPAVVEMKPGAGGTIAANIVAKSPPDGHTLFLMASGHAASPGLYKSLPYDAAKDFTVVSMISRSGLALVASTKAPFKSAEEMFEQARKNPGSIDYGSPGIGTGPHLAAAFVQAQGDVKLNHIPYKTQGDLENAVISGQIPVITSSLFGWAERVKDGKVRVIAVTSKERAVRFEDVPSLSEKLIPGFDVVGWTALAAPKGLPPAIADRLNQFVKETMRQPNVTASMQSNGTVLWSTTPQEAQRIVQFETERWTKMARDEKLTPEN